MKPDPVKADFHDPDILDSLFEYGDKLIFEKKYQEAIDFYYPLYLRSYEDGLCVGHICECLYALGKTENDIKWMIPPVVLKLDDNLVNVCVNILKEEILMFNQDLYEELFLNHSDFLAFNEEELLSFLSKKKDKFKIEKGIFVTVRSL